MNPPDSAFSKAQQKWDRIYTASNGTPEAARILSEYAYLLPSRGAALDLACGLGGNAIFLAENTGLQVHAWDCSGVAVARLQQRASEQSLKLDAVVADANDIAAERGRYDVIVVSRYLERGIAADIIAALKPEGLLFYQTFCQCKQEGVGPGNPDYLLKRNELLSLFAELWVVAYHEDGLLGDRQAGYRNEAYLVAQKNKPDRF